MKIAMFTNTYLPHVGGVARSVKTLEDHCRSCGHEVRVIAPEFKGAVKSEYVLRVPAIQNFNGSDFSVQLPAPHVIGDFMKQFQPDIIHSHHPFLLGDAALREAWKLHVPIVFTHHTLYERYTHYVPLDSPALKRVAIQLATEYCNLCDQVIAPSESIERLLKDRGVTRPIRAIPTGIDTTYFAAGNGRRFREKLGLPAEARIIGHVGRLAMEKNLRFLSEAVGLCLEHDASAVFLVVGAGDAHDSMRNILLRKAAAHQIHFAGNLTGQDLADAYAAMDWFVFASQSETQGLVLAEAMATGKPVVALDGPGVREIVCDGSNGLLLDGHASVHEFASALMRLMLDPELSRQMADNARLTAENFTTDRCVRRVIECYETAIAKHTPRTHEDDMPWDRLREKIALEWDLLVAKLSAAAAGVLETTATEASLD